MKTKPSPSFFALSFFLILLIWKDSEVAVEAKPDLINKAALVVPSDTSSFKAFTTDFFRAVKARDTAFLKTHVLFPILNSSFGIFDKSLRQSARIDASAFLKNLDKFFPIELVEKAKGGEISISKQGGGQAYYVLTCYEESGGVESNYSWIFIKKGETFYFKNFRTEAG